MVFSTIYEKVVSRGQIVFSFWPRETDEKGTVFVYTSLQNIVQD